MILFIKQQIANRYNSNFLSICIWAPNYDFVVHADSKQHNRATAGQQPPFLIAHFHVPSMKANFCGKGDSMAYEL